MTPRGDPATLSDQPFDLELFKVSALYRRSRELFLAKKGVFRATLVSPARSLGSANLVLNEIEYSPIGNELEWSLADRLQRKDLKHLEQVRVWITGIFHEQNHRNLWHFFREKKIYFPQDREAAYRLLNLTESLVIILDMALGDELEPRMATGLYDHRVIYNPGAAFMRKLGFGSRAYRNALQVCLHATYLRLEGLHPEDIPAFVHAAFPQLKTSLVDQCIERALLMEPLFLNLTNPVWQKKNVRVVMQAFAPPRGKKGLTLPAKDPQNNLSIYVIAEQWMDRVFS